jgi:transcriptional regulator with XRE-family HTH domain
VTALPEIERTVSELGAKVARARAERGWSLAQLAHRSGLSPATVHKIEKSGMTPTIASLMKVAAALGKSVSYFVDEPSTPHVNVIRGDERARVYTSKQGLELRNLSGRYGGFAMAGADATVEPRADSGPTPMNHPGEELVIVLEGRMEFDVDGATHEIGEGDSIHFRSVRPHSWRNPTDEPARAIWLVVRAS